MSLRILLADDNDITREVTELSLGLLGYQVATAINGLAVLDALAQDDYDLIFMDVEMPKMNGVVATQKIRSTIAAEKQPYIIALTGNAMLDDQARYAEAGMNDHISKPFQIKDLEEALRKAKIALGMA